MSVRQWLQFFRSGQESEIAIRCTSIDKLLNELDASPGNEQCREWLRQARHAIDRWPVFDFSAAWEPLFEIRHIFCGLLPWDKLIHLVLEVRDDLPYVTDAAEAKRCKTTINTMIEALSFLARQDEATKERVDINRETLLHISLVGANARQSQWRKVNLLRWRLRVTAFFTIALAVLLIVPMVVYPRSFGIEPAQSIWVLWVVIFGGLGGLLSSLLKREPLAGGSVGFYIERAVLLLQPIIGATTGLLAYILLLAGPITIEPKAAVPASYFIAAFCAGFSERVFLKHLIPALDSDGDAGTKSKDS